MDKQLREKVELLAERSIKFRDLYFLGKWQELGYPTMGSAERFVICALLYNHFTEDEVREVMKESAVGGWAKGDEQYRNLLLEDAKRFIEEGKNEGEEEGEEGKEEVNVWELSSVIEDMHIYRQVFHTSSNGSTSFWYYSGRSWMLGAESVLEGDIVAALSNPGTAKPSKTLLDTVSRIVRSHTTVWEDKLKMPPLTLINLRNGVFDLETGVLHPHSPDYWFTSCIEVDYNPDAKCPNFLRFLSEILRQEDIPTMQEMLGYILHRSNFARRAFMLIGSGSNGKSLLLQIVEEWLGKANVSHLPLQELEWSRWGKAALLGKHANIFADLPQSPLGKSEVFRAVTGDDTLDAERKFHPYFTFKPYAKLIFSTNRLPAIREDEVDAFFKRWIIIEFPNTFPDDMQKREAILRECLTDEEKSGILNWALEGLRRLLQNRKFTGEETTVSEIRDRWMRESNPAYDFLATYVEKDQSSYIPKQELWSKYIEWCEAQGLPPPRRQNEFSTLVSAIFAAVTRRIYEGETRIWVWGGIRWKRDNGGEGTLPLEPNNSGNDADLHDFYAKCSATFDAMYQQSMGEGVPTGDIILRLEREGIPRRIIDKWLQLSLETRLTQKDGKLKPL
ncbi:MAG: phage/plasmid primase, P4 family [Thermoprotei archaeon]